MHFYKNIRSEVQKIMETGVQSFVEKIETFVNGLLKLIKGFLALLGLESLSLGA